MDKFTFRLDTVLSVRKQEENAALKDLKVAEVKLTEIRQQIAGLEAEQHETELALKGKRGSGGSAAEFTGFVAYLGQVQRSITARQDDFMRATNVVGQKRRALAEASKRKKMIENLREKQYLRWKAEQEKLEAKNLDEIATMRHQRGKQGPS